MPRTKPRKTGANIPIKPALTAPVSDMFYQRALNFNKPFRLRDIASRHELGNARLWLHALIARGELKWVEIHNTVWYSWINE